MKTVSLGFDNKSGSAYIQRSMRVGRYLVGLAALLPLSAGAQDSGPAPAVGVVHVDEAGAGGGTLSVADRQALVEQRLADMREALRRITEILGEANTSKDIVQLNCVNEKLTQVKGLLRVSEESASKMYEALASNMMDSVEHEYTKVAVAHQKVGVLRAEAEQCVGEYSVYSGDTEVTVEVDTELPDGSDTPPPGPEMPPVASAS